MNAIGLASELSASSRPMSIPVVIDDSAYFFKFKRVILGLKDDTNSSVVYNGVEIVDGQSPVGENLKRQKSVQISRESAGNKKFRFGDAEFNIYVEEPGANSAAFLASDFAKLSRGQPITDENGRVHLRLNPGLRADDSGINLPKVHISSTNKAAIAARLASTTQPNLPGDLAAGSWGFIYRHKFAGDQGRQYFQSVALTIHDKTRKKPLYIFDFSHVDDVGRLGKKSNLVTGLLLGYVRAFNHLLPDGRYLKSSGPHPSLVTVIHLGLADHQTFVDVMNASDLPVAVTGTQSLFEAISLGRAFYYEVLPWKRNLVFGLADHALLHFDYYEAKFLVGLLLGDADYLGDVANFERMKRGVRAGKPVKWRLIEINRKAYFEQILLSPEKQLLMARFSKSLQQAPSIAASVEATIDAAFNDPSNHKK